MLVTEVLGLPVPGRRTASRLTPALERPQSYRLTDLVNVRPSSKNSDFLTITWKRESKPILQQKGIYIWTHPQFGIFYLGIARADNLDQRWDAHIQKLLNRAKVTYPRRWREFAQLFLAQGVSSVDSSRAMDDLAPIKIYFYPVNKPADMSDEDYAKAIEDLETRIEARWNPRAQGKYKPDYPSVTRNIDKQVPRDPRGMVNLKKKK